MSNLGIQLYFKNSMFITLANTIFQNLISEIFTTCDTLHTIVKTRAG